MKATLGFTTELLHCPSLSDQFHTAVTTYIFKLFVVLSVTVRLLACVQQWNGLSLCPSMTPNWSLNPHAPKRSPRRRARHCSSDVTALWLTGWWEGFTRSPRAKTLPRSFKSINTLRRTHPLTFTPGVNLMWKMEITFHISGFHLLFFPSLRRKKSSRINPADAAGVFWLTRETFKAAGNLKEKLKLVLHFPHLALLFFTQTMFWKHRLVESNWPALIGNDLIFTLSQEMRFK